MILKYQDLPTTLGTLTKPQVNSSLHPLSVPGCGGTGDRLGQLQSGLFEVLFRARTGGFQQN